MTIRFQSAIAHLVKTVRAELALEGVTATVDFGKRALESQSNQGPGRANRVVFLAFDPKSGAAGRLGEPSQVGPRDIMSSADPTVRVGSVRALADWQRALVVSIWAHDGDAANDDLAQEVALEQLVEATVRAVHRTGFAEIVWGATSALVQGERRFGRENRFALQFTHPLFDLPKDIAFPGLKITKTATDQVADDD